MLRLISGILLLISICWPANNAAALDIMLPQIYTENIDISGWLVSEKLDGVRGYWDGKRLLSKNGNPLYPPPEFTKNFPDFALEGEIWGGRGTFAHTVAVVKRRSQDSGWLGLRFAIFDVPMVNIPFVQRLKKAEDWFAGHASLYAFIIPQKPVVGSDDLHERLKQVEKLGGEGLIVRRPDTIYHNGRSADILKVKSYLDAEATVIALLPGAGRNKGRLGSLLVEDADAIRFKIGSGFSDAEREEPPPLGAIITYKYYGRYQTGLPKFPVFLRARTDAGM